MNRIWFLRTGNHLCEGAYGTAGDEYGRKTYYLRLPGGILVVAGRHWTYDEILAEEDGDRDMADRVWAGYADGRAARDARGRTETRLPAVHAIARLGRTPAWRAAHPERTQTLIGVLPDDSVSYVLDHLIDAGGATYLGVLTEHGLRVVSLRLEATPENENGSAGASTPAEPATPSTFEEPKE